jgi:hypothetical protein
MGRIYLIGDAADIARRRRLLPREQLVEVWPDMEERDRFWLGAESKAALDAAGAPIEALLSLDDRGVPIYYGPRLSDVDSLPEEASVRARVLSTRGVAVAWITLDHAAGETASSLTPTHPVFFLRRPGGDVLHAWRLFRRRAEAVEYVTAHFPADEDAMAWARTQPAECFDDLLAHFGERG